MVIDEDKNQTEKENSGFEEDLKKDKDQIFDDEKDNRDDDDIGSNSKYFDSLTKYITKSNIFGKYVLYAEVMY